MRKHGRGLAPRAGPQVMTSELQIPSSKSSAVQGVGRAHISCRHQTNATSLEEWTWTEIAARACATNDLIRSDGRHGWVGEVPRVLAPDSKLRKLRRREGGQRNIMMVELTVFPSEEGEALRGTGIGIGMPELDILDGSH